MAGVTVGGATLRDNLLGGNTVPGAGSGQQGSKPGRGRASQLARLTFALAFGAAWTVGGWAQEPPEASPADSSSVDSSGVQAFQAAGPLLRAVDDVLELSDSAHLPEALGRYAALPSLGFHRGDDLAFAFYQPAITAPSQDHESDESEVLSRGRLWLGERAFSSPEVAVASLSLDVADALMYSILLAAFDGLVQGGATWATDLDFDRLQGLAAFGAHVVALRNEIERSQRRRLERGRSGLCEQLRAGAGLFQLWKAVMDPSRPFLVDSFQSSLPTPGQAPGRGVMEVSPAEKRLVVEKLLEVEWSGDPKADLGASYCTG